jgi:hypothetical protein
MFHSFIITGKGCQTGVPQVLQREGWNGYRDQTGRSCIEGELDREDEKAGEKEFTNHDPYLFFLAIRINPLNLEATPEIQS